MRVQITSGFGEIDSAHTEHAHQGIDFALPMDTPLRAFQSGIVEKVTHEGSKSFGDAVWIKFPDGYRAVMGHLDKVYVRPGDHVYIGELIAKSGNTGHSTGPHLHLGIMDPNGHWIDPSRYIELQRVLTPKIGHGSPKDWANDLVASWFDKVGTALGNGVESLFHELMAELTEHMPEIASTLFVVGGFLKMFSSKKWAPRLFVAAGVGVAWTILL